MSGGVLSKKIEMEEDDRRRKRLMEIVGPSVMLMVCSQSMLTQARSELASKICFENGPAAAKMLSLSMGIGASLEFFLNPALMRFSDGVGRRPVLVGAALASAITRFMVFVSPNSRNLLVGDRVITLALTATFFQAIRAAQADVSHSTQDLTDQAASVARWAGLGILVGPYLDPILQRLGGGSARSSFLGASLLGFITTAMLNAEFEETLREADKKDEALDAKSSNPFSFVKLLSSNKVIASLLGVLLLQSFTDVRNIIEVKTLFMKNHLNFGKVQIGNVIAAYGAAVMISSLFVKSSIKAFGIHGHTAIANFSEIVSSLLIGLAPTTSPFDVLFTNLSIFASIPAHRKKDTVESLAIQMLGQETDMGKGEIAAALGNWKSLSTIIGPLLFGHAYAWGTERKIPGAPFFLAALFALSAHRMYQVIPEEKLQVSANNGNTSNRRHVVSGEPRQVPSLVPDASNAKKTTVLVPGRTFLNKSRQQITLKEKIVISHDTRIFRFALPEPNMVLGLPVGRHIRLYCPNPKTRVKAGEWNGRPDPETGDEIVRKYTPGSLNGDLGFMDLVIKVYKGGVNERFPDGGKMSQYLESLRVGDKVDVDGPWGHVEYHGNGEFTIRKERKQYINVGMIAGGTGLTPMLQIIRTILNNPADTTKISLLYANQSEPDILLRTLLDYLAVEHSDRFRVHYTIDRPPANWEYSTGYINEQMLMDRMPPNQEGSLILMCGPPGMIQFACKQNLDKLGYPKDMQVAF